MSAEQTFEPITLEALPKKAREMKQQGYRLVQIGATRLPEHVELTYSFDREAQLLNFRLQVPAAGARVPSISAVYWCAFLYENELHDLFNVEVDGLAVDFHGHFYKTAIPFPFGSTKPPVTKTATAQPSKTGSTPTQPVTPNT